MTNIESYKILLKKNMSFADRLNSAAGHPSGFDYLRIFLAFVIIFIHCITLNDSGGEESEALLRPIYVFRISAVPMFFALSGFLVAGSLDRVRTTGGFLCLRLLRIFPALAVDTLFCALVLGISMTTLPLKVYFGSPVTHQYLLNMLGAIHYRLPGVFEKNPLPLVNGQLWTLPYEFACYAALAMIATVGIYKKPKLLIVSTLLLTAIEMGAFWIHFHYLSYRMMVIPGFLIGVCFHVFRDEIPAIDYLFLVSLAVMVAGAAFPVMMVVMPLPLVYATIYIGCANPKKAWLIKSGDYSYGMYLYGTPIIQALIASAAWSHRWYICLSAAVPIIFLFAFLSWHLIEKRCLSLKHQVLKLETLLGKISSLHRNSS